MPRNLDSGFALENCFFGGAEVAKNADPDKYSYSCYGIGFDTRTEFSLPDYSLGKNVVIFGVDMSLSLHIDNEGKDILILGKGPIQGLDGTTLTAETRYSINFTRPNIKFCLSLPYNESNSFLFVNATKIYQFRGKDLEIAKIFLEFGKYFRKFVS